MPIKKVRPGPGQESVWDYPRPPAVQPSSRHVEVVFGGVVIADTRRALRVLETGHPPVYYIPVEDVAQGILLSGGHVTYCEYKGEAHYFTVVVEDRTERDAAWSFPAPGAGYEELAGRVAFYPRMMDACLVDGELVRPQPGAYYGGWITADLAGPFVGDPALSDR